MAPQTEDTPAPAEKWCGNEMTQEDMMIKDTVLVLDQNDNVIGSESKKGSHIFNKEQPRGILHRAFSAFLFDEKTGDLLLQKRAASKITFPNVSRFQLFCFCFCFCNAYGVMQNLVYRNLFCRK